MGKVIKCRHFIPLPMPDSMIARVEQWARMDKQARYQNLAFQNRNMEWFGWGDDDDGMPLVEDSTVEPPLPAPFPDIPAELPGIPLKCNDLMLALTIAPGTVPAPMIEDLARRALTNANIGPNIIPSEDVEDDRSGLRGPQQPHVPQQPHFPLRDMIICRIFSDNDEAIGNDGDEGIPDLVNANDDSSGDEDDDDKVGASHNVGSLHSQGESDDKDKDYTPGDQEDVSLDKDRSATEHRSAEDKEETEPETVRRGTRTRETRLPRKLANFQMLLARGDFKQADEIEKELDSEMGTFGEVDEPIVLEEGKEAVLGCIMLQLSLKQGLKKWGKQGEESAMKEMHQMHDLNAFFP